MFSKACEYAIKATIFIAAKSEQEVKVSLHEIAHAIDSPASFTSKILQKLVRNKLIDSSKGPAGGFAVKKTITEKIRLSQIVAAIDGDTVYTACALGFHNCDDRKPCPMHFKFKVIRDELRNMLEQTNLHELSVETSKGITFLKRK